MIFIRRIIMTPSGPLYGLMEPEMSNRVIRKYHQYSDNFLRMTLYDDIHQTVKRMRYVLEKQLRQFLNDFTLLGKNFKFLAFSSNQIRNASAWFLSETQNLSREKLYNFLGDFSGREFY